MQSHRGIDMFKRRRRFLFTFDDGPDAVQTPKLLDTLAKYDIRAIFFVLGSRIASSEGQAIMRRAASLGHFIGNHSYDHPDLTRLSEKEIRIEIEKTQELIGDASQGVKLFRPPYGTSNSVVEHVVQELGFQTILWNVDSMDWNPDYQPDRWITSAITQMRPRRSSIVLAHDVHPSTVDGIDRLIKGAQSLPASAHLPEFGILAKSVRGVVDIPPAVADNLWWKPHSGFFERMVSKVMGERSGGWSRNS